MALNRVEVNEHDQQAFFDVRIEPPGNFIECKGTRIECDEECEQENELLRTDAQNRSFRTRKVCGTTVVIDPCKDDCKNTSDKKINLNEINIQLEGSHIFEKLKDFPRIFENGGNNLGVTFKCEKHGASNETEITVNLTASKPKQTVCPNVEQPVINIEKENEDPEPIPKPCKKNIQCKPCKKETPEEAPKARKSIDSNKLKDDLEQFRKSLKKEDPEPIPKAKKISTDSGKPKEVQEPPKAKRKSLDSGQKRLEDQEYKIIKQSKKKSKDLDVIQKPRKLCKVRCCGVMVVIAEDKNCSRKAYCCSKKRRNCCCDCHCCSPRKERRNRDDLKEKREGSIRAKRGGSYRGRRGTRPHDGDISEHSEFSDVKIPRKQSRRPKKSKFSVFSDGSDIGSEKRRKKKSKFSVFSDGSDIGSEKRRKKKSKFSVFSDGSDKGSEKMRKKKSKFGLFQSDGSYESEEDRRSGKHKKSGVSTIPPDGTDEDEYMQSGRRTSKSSEKSKGTANDESEEKRGSTKGSLRKKHSFFKSDETDYKSDDRRSGKQKKFSFFKSDETDKYDDKRSGKRRSILKTDETDYDDRKRRVSKSDPAHSHDDGDEDEGPKYKKKPSIFSKVKTVFKKKPSI